MEIKNTKIKAPRATVKKRPATRRKVVEKTVPAQAAQAAAEQTVAERAAAEPVVAEASMKVLVIDDDYYTRSIYESELHQQNIEVVTASSGFDGLVEARRHHPCIIVLELILPKVNGFELIKEIKQDSVLKNITIIVASMLGQAQDREEALGLGVELYLSKKDYSAKQIIAEVVNLLATKL